MNSNIECSHCVVINCKPIETYLSQEEFTDPVDSYFKDCINNKPYTSTYINVIELLTCNKLSLTDDPDNLITGNRFRRSNSLPMFIDEWE